MFGRNKNKNIDDTPLPPAPPPCTPSRRPTMWDYNEMTRRWQGVSMALMERDRELEHLRKEVERLRSRPASTVNSWQPPTPEIRVMTPQPDSAELQRSRQENERLRSENQYLKNANAKSTDRQPEVDDLRRRLADLAAELEHRSNLIATLERELDEARFGVTRPAQMQRPETFTRDTERFAYLEVR